jgi:hypothetical protein
MAATNRSPEGAQRIPGWYPVMVQYRRSRVAGGTFFFTVNIPVKHGHVARAMDWPHSTLHRYIKHGLLTADWACASPEGTFGE